jgi:hypothetical protein
MNPRKNTGYNTMPVPSLTGRRQQDGALDEELKN